MKDEISQSKPIVYNIGMPKSLNETLKFKVNCCWFLWQGNKKKTIAVWNSNEISVSNKE